MTSTPASPAPRRSVHGSLLREQFGDLDAARDVLARLANVLDVLEQPEPASDDTQQHKAAPASGGRSAKRKEA